MPIFRSATQYDTLPLSGAVMDAVPDLFNLELRIVADFKNILDSQNPAISPYQTRSTCTKHKNFHSNKKEESSLELDKLSVAVLSLPAHIYTALKLQYIHGLRFSDLKNINHGDVLPSGLINLRPTKGNTVRIIYFPDILSLISPAIANKMEAVFRFSYRQYYLIMRRAGIYSHISEKSVRFTVTHLFRHNRFTELMVLFSLDPSTFKNYSGHKSARSLSYYFHPDNNVLDFNQDTIKNHEERN